MANLFISHGANSSYSRQARRVGNGRPGAGATLRLRRMNGEDGGPRHQSREKLVGRTGHGGHLRNTQASPKWDKFTPASLSAIGSGRPIRTG